MTVSLEKDAPGEARAPGPGPADRRAPRGPLRGFWRFARRSRRFQVSVVAIVLVVGANLFLDFLPGSCLAYVCHETLDEGETITLREPGTRRGSHSEVSLRLEFVRDGQAVIAVNDRSFQLRPGQREITDGDESIQLDAIEGSGEVKATYRFLAFDDLLGEYEAGE